MPPLIHGVIFFCVFGLLFTALEWIRPARPVSYRAVIRRDLAALALYELVFAPVAILVSNSLVQGHAVVPARLLALPLPARVVLYFVLADLGMYWIHRLLHSSYLWRIHRWHHSPTYMYWLAGIRATLPQEILFTLPFALCAPLLQHAPPWLFLAIFAVGFLTNNWMHANVTWNSSRLERLLVTPRYHHVHHDAHPDHYSANLGALFTVWDRVFGTYVDPQHVQDLSFGIDGRHSELRLALGF
jgi:sterol desaturase/sphingolipid hydroxylase (fatty acid hydroxylase superfamily)